MKTFSMRSNGLGFAYFIIGVSVSIGSFLVCAYCFFFQLLRVESKNQNDEPPKSVEMPAFKIRHVWTDDNGLYVNDMNSNENGSDHRDSIRSDSKSSRRDSKRYSLSSRRSSKRRMSLHEQASFSFECEE